MKVGRLAIGVLACVVALCVACTDDPPGDDAAEQSGDPIAVEPGEEFTLVPKKVDATLGPDFVLSQGEQPVYVLTAGFGTSGPSATRVIGGKVLLSNGALRIDAGEALGFVMPEDVQAGSYSLCSSGDECFEITVEE